MTTQASSRGIRSTCSIRADPHCVGVDHTRASPAASTAGTSGGRISTDYSLGGEPLRNGAVTFETQTS